MAEGLEQNVPKRKTLDLFFVQCKKKLIILPYFGVEVWNDCKGLLVSFRVRLVYYLHLTPVMLVRP